ncbi:MULTISPECIES: N-acetyl-D-Glu racemase DgcA [Mesorhizobium]|uniref:Dipeptide epimerase n=1 Tax=Mesorhizobium denitrificans TaxID=2294114 RepID=A0A371XBS0_9HYPH|nr:MULTISPECIES: N-acetyl-D-Glu racemase DgcA [Mesorhizobium]RFC66641.1 dipeptide epimerase [Mesorhizobium denitrificans]
MGRVLSVTGETFPIAGAFTISRGSKTEAEVLVCTIAETGKEGRGECVPYKRYGETLESVSNQIEAIGAAIARGLTRTELLDAMPAGGARNAVDCALWDLEAKISGKSVVAMLGGAAPQPLITAYTLSLGSPESMAEQARKNAGRPLLKIKLGTDDDASRLRAVATAAPNSKLIVDANEGWTDDNLEKHLTIAAECGVVLIEQPLPAGKDSKLAKVAHVVPICADESVHVAADLESLRGLYDAVNIKLDKAGGLTEALRLRDAARADGFGIMVGCMVGSSLAMAPAVLLAQGADYVDLDGPLLLARDRTPALRYDGSTVSPPEPTLWG